MNKIPMAYQDESASSWNASAGGDRDGCAWRIVPSGETSALVEFDSHPDFLAANRTARAFAAALRTRSLPWITDVVPAMTTVCITYRPTDVPAVTDTGAARSPYTTQLVSGNATERSAYQCVVDFLERHLHTCVATETTLREPIDIPVCYGGEYGPDLEAVAQRLMLDPEQVIALHMRDVVEVLALGFAPGHPYIGLSDDRLCPPRRDTPRTAVPAGSVLIANRQTVIYGTTLPSGWHLIGRTPRVIFTPGANRPCLFEPGDKVRFMSIRPATFIAMEAAEKAKAYTGTQVPR